MAAANADSVQELGVPLPTTAAEVRWGRRRNTNSVESRPVKRAKMTNLTLFILKSGEATAINLRSERSRSQ
jgi:hypothetical protein